MLVSVLSNDCSREGKLDQGTAGTLANEISGFSEALDNIDIRNVLAPERRESPWLELGNHTVHTHAITATGSPSDLTTNSQAGVCCHELRIANSVGNFVIIQFQPLSVVNSLLRNLI